MMTKKKTKERIQEEKREKYKENALSKEMAS